MEIAVTSENIETIKQMILNNVITKVYLSKPLEGIILDFSRTPGDVYGVKGSYRIRVGDVAVRPIAQDLSSAFLMIVPTSSSSSVEPEEYEGMREID